MKKLYLIIAVILCLGIFTGCNATNNDSASTTSSPDESLEPLQPLFPLMYINTTNTDLTKASMGINLVHETAHTFGLSDQYNIPGHDVVNGYVCCMEKFDSDYAKEYYYKVKGNSSFAFCASCKNQLSGLIYDCWHPEHLNQ